MAISPLSDAELQQHFEANLPRLVGKTLAPAIFAKNEQGAYRDAEIFRRYCLFREGYKVAVDTLNVSH
jgi:hypothetical protein